MSVNSTFSFGGYNIFRPDPTLKAQIESQTQDPSSHVSAYVAIFSVLLLLYLLSPFNRPHGVDVPFYKAGKMKWIFDAETLVVDSYNKVSTVPRGPEKPISAGNVPMNYP
jgi:hypothetical protein